MKKNGSLIQQNIILVQVIISDNFLIFCEKYRCFLPQGNYSLMQNAEKIRMLILFSDRSQPKTTTILCPKFYAT